MDNNFFIHIVTIFGLIGIPSIFSMTMWCIKKCLEFRDTLLVLMQAQKAQMRADLLKDYMHFKERGYISDIELQEWQNQYKAYHKLVGENGVLDDRYKKLLNMPNGKGGETNE